MLHLQNFITLVLLNNCNKRNIQLSLGAIRLMKKKIILSLIFLLIGFIIWVLFSITSGVTYDEMCYKPILEVKGTTLELETSNSCYHSAMLIFYIGNEQNQEKKEITIWAYQAVGAPYKTKFNFDVSDIDQEEHKNYKRYCKVPNGIKTEIKVN